MFSSFWCKKCLSTPWCKTVWDQLLRILMNTNKNDNRINKDLSSIKPRCVFWYFLIFVIHFAFEKILLILSSIYTSFCVNISSKSKKILSKDSRKHIKRKSLAYSGYVSSWSITNKNTWYWATRMLSIYVKYHMFCSFSIRNT